MLKIGIGRSRVISCYSRDIGCLCDLIIWNIGVWRKGKELETGRECLARSVSLKDQTVVGCADQGLNCTNRMLGVGGSRNR